ncbi:hypothetical protein CEP51_007292 [Fusarium floridanum]|uniref:Uncharacterized protein n=1 Tax=Fusarium floridanum TaxID=1325733 RepID=A0A428RPQ1_9HYPO|nr:hypothetical protein CEP51_007292 [Fusarium floridanum]
MTNTPVLFVQESPSTLASSQGQSGGENNEGLKASDKSARNHSPTAMETEKGTSTSSISSSPYVETDKGGSIGSKKDEDEAGDPDSLLKPSNIDFLGIGSQFGDYTR